MELPGAVERQVAAAVRRGPGGGVVGGIGQHLLLVGIRHEGGVARLFVFGKNGFVFPIGRLDFGFLHLLEGEPCLAVGGVVVYAQQASVAQAVHFLRLAGTERAYAVGGGLAADRLEGEACIVPHALLRRPLQQVVDGGVAAAVVEVLGVKGIFNHAAGEREHLDVPVLSAVHHVGLFAYNAGVVLTRVAVAQHQRGLGHRTDAVGERHVEARPLGPLDAEVCRAVAACLLHGQQHQFVAHAGCSHGGTVGGHEQQGVAVGHCVPQLSLVRTVVLACFKGVAGGAQCQVLAGVDDAPCPRELVHGEMLCGGLVVEFGQAQPPVGLERHGVARLGLRQHVVERALAECLSLHREGTRQPAEHECAEG